MSGSSKRMRIIRDKLLPQQYSIEEAILLLKELSKVRFTESVDVAINLGIDPRKSEQVVRGSTILPYGTGKQVKVAVFAQGNHAEVAKTAGADLVGLEDLADTIRAGNLDFDVVIATPDTMRVVGQLGKILGPRGLMPNPKVGTVTQDVANAVHNAKSGQVRYKTDKGGIIHCIIGNIEFSIEQLRDNLRALLLDLQKLKPVTSKGIYIRRVTVSTTMGAGISIDQATLLAGS